MEGGNFITGQHPYHIMNPETVDRTRLIAAGIATGGIGTLGAMVPLVRNYVVESVRETVNHGVKRGMDFIDDTLYGVSEGVQRWVRRDKRTSHNSARYVVLPMRSRKYYFESLGNKFPLFT